MTTVAFSPKVCFVFGYLEHGSEIIFSTPTQLNTCQNSPLSPPLLA